MSSSRASTPLPPEPERRRRLPLLGRLDRYVLGYFGWSYLTALLLVVGLFWILDLAANVDEYMEPDAQGNVAPSIEIARFYVFNLPYVFLQVAPFVTLLAGMFTLSRMSKQNEMVAALAAGISVHRLLMPVFAGGLVAALLMFGAREWTAAHVAEPRDSLRDQLENHRPRREYRNLFLTDLAGSFVRMGSFLPAQGEQPAEIHGLEANLQDWVTVSASSARWDGERWSLVEGQRRSSRPGTEDQGIAPVEVLDGVDFTPADVLTLRRARDLPLELSFGEVQSMIRREPEDRTYQTLWQYHLTFPLANLILLLVGLPLLVKHERGGGAERMAVGGLLCVVYFAVDYVFRNLGLEGSLSPILASWLPVLAFGSLGVVLVEGMRT